MSSSEIASCYPLTVPWFAVLLGYDEQALLHLASPAIEEIVLGVGVEAQVGCLVSVM